MVVNGAANMLLLLLLLLAVLFLIPADAAWSELIADDG